ncbi:MAG: sulfotransferase [Gaiellaceae bacterium]
MIDFAIVGQPKSGTTALAEFLGRHPQICMSFPKEPVYFATDLIEESDALYGSRQYFEFRTEQDYVALFEHCGPGQLRGEASTPYLLSKLAAANIAAVNPNAKIIVMLREPVSFLHSLHMEYVNETIEDEPDFARALELEPLRKGGRALPARVRCPSYLFYRERAKYSAQLARYYAVFPRENVLVMTMEEFRRDNEGHYRTALGLLGVDADYAPAFGVVYASRAARSRRLNQVLNTPAFKRALFKALGARRYTNLQKRVARLVMKEQPRPALDPQLEGELRNEFGAEVERVSELVGRDLRPVWSYRAG